MQKHTQNTKWFLQRHAASSHKKHIYQGLLPAIRLFTGNQRELFFPPLFCFIPVFYPLSCPPLIAGQVWEIIGRLSGVFNGAALMESFSRTSPDFITSVRQLRLIYKAVWGRGNVRHQFESGRLRRDVSLALVAGCPSIIPPAFGVEWNRSSHSLTHVTPLAGGATKWHARAS